jgi:hypothetical protein
MDPAEGLLAPALGILAMVLGMMMMTTSTKGMLAGTLLWLHQVQVIVNIEAVMEHLE